MSSVSQFDHLQRGGLGNAIACKAQFRAIHVLQVQTLEENLQHYLTRTHA
jgi:hypothetical protein